MQVPRRREKADNVWAEDSWNQFLQELETGQKVSVGLGLWEWLTLSQCILASELAPSDSPSRLQPKKPLVDDPAEKPSQPIEVSAAGKVGEGETAMLGDKGESLGDAGPGDHGQRTQIPQLPPSPALHSSSLYPHHTTVPGIQQALKHAGNKCVLTKAGAEKRVVSVAWNFQEVFLEVR